MSHNKLLTNLTCATRTKEYWPAVVFARTSLHSVCVLPRPWANIPGQYFPVQETMPWLFCYDPIFALFNLFINSPFFGLML